jgi:hypothetical protein
MERHVADATAPKAAPSGEPGVGESPILALVADLRTRVEAEASQPGGKLTCDDLVRLIGVDSHALALLIFSLLNTLPAPPGYNFVMGLLMTVMAAMMLLGREIRLWPPVIGRMKLPLKLMLKLLGVLGKLAGIITRFSRPRLEVLTGGAVLPLLAIIAFILAVSTLPPIPAGNLLPSVAVAMICVGILNRDGLVVLSGIVVGIVGLAIVVIAMWLVYALFFVVEEVVEDVIDGEFDGQ